jgi:hypothetical protein
MPQMPNNPNLNCLVELANRDGVDIRPTLLRVMTDLYVQKPVHSTDEERHFTELALRLFDLVDASTRAIVADKIAGYANAPAAVRRRVLRHQIAVNEPAGGARPAADPFAGSKAVAEELSELFFAASAEERRLILANLPYAPLAPAPPIAAALAREATERLEVAALGHNGESFARELQRALAISLTLARRVLDDRSGEPIVVAAIALGMPASVLQRVLLCLNPSISQSVQRVYDLALLHEELSPEAARRLLAIWQANGTAQESHMQGRKAPQPNAQDDRLHSGANPPQSAAIAPARRTMLVGRPEILWDEHAKSRKAESG